MVDGVGAGNHEILRLSFVVKVDREHELVVRGSRLKALRDRLQNTHDLQETIGSQAETKILTYSLKALKARQHAYLARLGRFGLGNGMGPQEACLVGKVLGRLRVDNLLVVTVDCKAVPPAFIGQDSSF